ncbi:hypothetical protein C8Q80DRAFT_498375 [Daedaleopsis nitida]|nr:hypothetical protein C8Q80DRAFT_498375 [Daedaleopsis nitida]
MIAGLVLSLASSATHISFGIRIFSYHSLSQAMVTPKAHGIASITMFFITDALVSGALCYYLYTSRTGMPKSDDIITKLITLTVTTGGLCVLSNFGAMVSVSVVCLPVVASLASAMTLPSSRKLTEYVVQYLVAPQKTYVVFFTFMMAKLYANALLTTLNMREYIRENTSSAYVNNTSASAQTRSGSSTLSPTGVDGGAQRCVVINVDRLQEVHSDLDMELSCSESEVKDSQAQEV